MENENLKVQSQNIESGRRKTKRKNPSGSEESHLKIEKRNEKRKIHTKKVTHEEKMMKFQM